MKTKHYLLAALLILFMSFLISYNGEYITGKYSKNVNEITGEGFLDWWGDFFIPFLCVDDETGKDSFFKGTVNFENDPIFDTGTKEDSCAKLDGCIGGFGCHTVGQMLEWYCGVDSIKLDVVDCPSGYECSNGICISASPSPPATECIDYDGGNYPFIKSQVAVGDILGKDKCVNAPFYDEISEAICKDNSLSFVGSHCDNLCNDGACICVVDSDCGKTGYICDSGVCTLEKGIDCETHHYEGMGICTEQNTETETVCVWTNDHCCRDEEVWDVGTDSCISAATAGEEMCYLFWPDDIVKDESVNYLAKKICLDVGSKIYGYWTSVIPY